MTELLAPPAPDGATVKSTGMVGDRELVCVQTINIGRLRSDPVPISPSCFVAVGGRGPRRDSNGSGKTTFLGAVSLLLGDVGWRRPPARPRQRACCLTAPGPVSTSNATPAPTTATSSACSPRPMAPIR
jgi:hypothetical protein